MKKSAFLSDVLFAFTTVCVFTLCLFRYLGTRLLPALFLSVLCGVLAAAAVAAWLQNKRKNVLTKRSDEAQKQKLLLHLALLSDEQKTSFFESVFQKCGEAVKRFGKLRLQTENSFYFLKFSFAPVTADEVARVSRLKTAKPKILLCSEIDDAALRLCTRLGITAQVGEAPYALVKKAEALPENYLGEETPENKRQKRRRLCFAKTNAKRFLTSGVLILFTSLLTPFPYYYLVFGSLLLLAALLVRIFGYS